MTLESTRKLRRFGINNLSTTELNAIADEIQAEVDEQYMKTPVDDDGVPIHIGDQMVCSGAYDGTFTVDGFCYDGDDWYFTCCGSTFVVLGWRHATPRTPKDVLNEFYYKMEEAYGRHQRYKTTDDEYRELKEDILEEYASELQMRDEEDVTT